MTVDDILKIAIPVVVVIIGAVVHLYQRITKLEEKWDFFWRIYGDELIARVKKNPHTPELNALLEEYKTAKREHRRFPKEELHRLLEALQDTETNPNYNKDEKAAAKSLIAMILKGW